MSLMHFPRETVYTFQDLTLSEKFLRVNGEYLFSLYYLLRSLCRHSLSSTLDLFLLCLGWTPVALTVFSASRSLVCAVALVPPSLFLLTFASSFFCFFTYIRIFASWFLAGPLFIVVPSFLLSVVLISVSEFLFKGREGFLGGRTSCRPVGGRARLELRTSSYIAHLLGHHGYCRL